ncbi:MAG: class II SORL domain-containing protein [Bacillota bacterium]|jgi:superoxide reductase|nr:desulfoferrodoxin [Bacillota bacterium]HOA90335.1 class II SORL domain-containing protein [Bacillota bacterium]HOP54056.1 class II SORL domain-containing protein [Bacillota bacterium]HPT61642.1 class II SORL domain-containing protein [Bacillota bacterium]HPZ72479.1 class II SORL domain-containing protein [Bacillota bacterium]
MERIGDYLYTFDGEGKEKHVPVIKAPEKVKAGEPFEVTVIVGDEVPHPNTVEHHIKWIALFAKPEKGNIVHIATFDMGPTYAAPRATFPVMLKQNSTLFAVEYCNIHGLWESSMKITVE